MKVDAQLLNDARAGDPIAMATLLREARPDIHRYAAYTCGRTSAVEEVVQEALLVVSRKLDQLRTPGGFVGWAFTIVARICAWPALALRRALMAGSEAGAQLPGAPRSADDLRIDIARALESLPATHREVIIMRDLEGCTITEMATRLGISRAATKSRLHRARALAREFLSG
ncbi:MAG: sigma-70 family RNA polymerase sigma factor [Myxococcales bacterium]|nr:sigma-70 family RNA polymerase sigma factor [Myxococcales bacterium]